ncbi:MAG TPA: AAA family ATPase [Chloroflexota bacterium]
MSVKIRKRPRLVIVSGSSASGKSSIARDIAAEMGLAFLALDDVKEGLFDSLGVPKDDGESERLDIAAHLLIDRLGRRILESGVGLVVEGNFWRGRAELTLGPLVARSRAAIVHCQIAPEAMVKRIKKRVEGKKPRHPGHRDAEPDPEFVRSLEDPEEFVAARKDLEPPNVVAPILRLDTTEDHDPDVEPIVEWVKKVTKVS